MSRPILGRGAGPETPGRPAPRITKATALLTLVPLTLALLGSCDKPTQPSPPAPDRTLTVEIAGPGHGTVTSQPAGIECNAGGGTCTLNAPHGTRVTLTAAPDERSSFGGWSQACNGTGACQVTLNGNQTVGASFGNPRLATAEIGPAGGTLVSADGRVTLVVPADALAAATTLSIEAIDANELGPEFRELDVDAAYRLGPEGQTFGVPVHLSMASDQQLEATDSTLTWEAEFLATSRDGALELLDGLRTDVAADGTITARGASGHFSPLVKYRLEKRIVFEAHGVPHRMGVGAPTDVRFEIHFAALGFRGVAAAFEDLAEAPVEPISIAPRATMPLQRTHPQWEGLVTYSCNAIGEGAWRGRLMLQLADDHVGDLAPYNGRSLNATLARDVGCLAPVEVVVEVDGPGTVLISGDGLRSSFCHENQACPIAAVPGNRVLLVALGEGFIEWAGESVSDPAVPDQRFRVTGPTRFIARFRSTTPTIGFAPRGTVPLARNAETLVIGRGTPAAGGQSATNRAPRGRSIHAANTGPVLLATVAADTVTDPMAFNAGRLNVFDISDPAAPMRLDSLRQFCPGARNVFLSESAFVPGVTITGVSPHNRGLCQTSFPVPAGTGLTDWGHVPGSGAAIPRPDGSLSHRYVITSFSFSQLAIVDPRNQPNRNVTLTATRSCPFSVVATATHAYVVAREGAPGTSTATCNDHRGLYVVDVDGAQLDFVVPVGTKPREVVLSPDGTKAYVTDFDEDRVHVVDLAARAVVRTLAVGDGPVGIDVTPDGRHLLVTNWNSNRVQLIDEVTGEILAEADSRGPQPVKVLLAPDGTTVAVLNFGNESAPGSVSLYTLERP